MNKQLLSTFSMERNELAKEGDLAHCFYFAALTLCGDSFDKLNKNEKKPEDLLPSEYCHGNVIVAFYLYRRALELQIKKLAASLKVDITGKNDIRAMWQGIMKERGNFERVCGIEDIIGNVEQALNLLDSYALADSEQIFQVGSQSTRSGHYKSVGQKECETLLSAYYDVRYFLLCIEEIKVSRSTDSLLKQLEAAL